MTRVLSLAHLTVLDLAPPRMVEVAARIGYASVGLRLIAVTDTTPGYPLMKDRGMLQETKAALRETGIRVNDIEFVKITPELDIRSLEPMLAAGAELGARHIITAPYDPDLCRLADQLAGIAELSQPHGISPVLEFFPWTNVPDLATAHRVAEATARADVGILLDTLHFSRSGSRPEDLAGRPMDRFSFIHLCDAPVLADYSTEQLLHSARAERMAPGAGQIDLRAILAPLPTDIPISLEIPMETKRIAEGSEAVAEHVFQQTQAFLGAGTT